MPDYIYYFLICCIYVLLYIFITKLFKALVHYFTTFDVKDVNYNNTINPKDLKKLKKIIKD